MPARPPAQARVETLISRGRLALAVFVLLASQLAPGGAANSRLAASLAVAYLVGAGALVALAYTPLVASTRWPPASHAADAAIFGWYLFAIGGLLPAGIAWFVFLLVAATLRWGWRGAIGTGSIGLALFVPFGAKAAGAVPGAVGQYLSAAGLLAVLTALVGLVGAYEEWRGRQIARLAAWSAPDPAQPTRLASEMLAQAAVVLEVPRTMLVWEEADEPWTEVAVWENGETEHHRSPPGTFGEIVPARVAETSFFCRQTRAQRPVTYYRGPKGLETWPGVPLDERLRERFEIGALAAWPLRGEDFRGWLFCLDRPGLSEQDLIMGEVVADLAAARLEQAYLVQRLRDSAVSSERLRLARDLHDGILQTLTGAALQVQSARRLLASDAGAAEERLSQVQRVIAAGQNDLRRFIQQLGPQRPDEEGTADLSGLVQELADRIRRQWGVPLTVATEPLRLDIPAGMVQELFFLVHEALVNAARHAHASSIQLAVLAEADRVSVSVVDDGRGFPVPGQYSIEQLAARDLGPRSLRERVSALGGALSIDTGESGTRIRMTIPLGRQEIA
ncbi:MAG TPA: histidine kinase [Methylomirabilota bacterium]